jgi:hypothetical protein
LNKKAEFLDINKVQNDMKLIDEKLKTFKDYYDHMIDYLFNNWIFIQNDANSLCADTALKIANYAIKCVQKLKNNELMDRIKKIIQKKHCIYYPHIFTYNE